MRKPVVHLYTVCWDEADMLGFFFRHYDPWVDRYVIYDDGSTDDSVAILQAHPKVELRRLERTHADSFVLSHKAMQDEAWKESRGAADWVCITAIDEHLHAGGRPMADVLAEAQGAGVTLLPALGFDMNHPEIPDDAGLLVERVTRGRARIAFNKLSLFRPDFVRETGFGPGRHAAEPVGDLVLPARDTVMLWHYKHLGFERNATREAAQRERLGKVDVAQDFGQHYRWTKERLRGFWDEMERESHDLATPDFIADAAAVRPLWWEARPDIRRQAPKPAVAASVGGAPTVSVLIKAYNHAAYVGRTIESVLEQSFQDFEIVVTDDGSSDATAAVIGRYADPRIHLEVLPENRGISGAMNATIARARGRYLAILNSDDWALPGRLAKQVEFLDANPAVSLVFGMPQAVDEAGQPTHNFFDFTEGLRLPSFTPEAWLRRFFDGNCLCAPTAMIRSEVYREIGLYDPKLTNLQDYDFWLRASLAGRVIHVLDEPLTAFRVRDNGGNMSAPQQPGTILRSAFEHGQIVRRYAELTEAQFESIFGGDAQATIGLPVALRVAELALQTGHPGNRNAALELYFENARTQQDFARLRTLGGTVDVFGSEGIAEQAHRLREAEQRWSATVAEQTLRLNDTEQRWSAAVAERDQHRMRHEAVTAALADRDKTIAENAAAIEGLSQALAAALASRERIRTSLAWRSTAPLRWIGRRVKAIRRLGR